MTRQPHMKRKWFRKKSGKPKVVRRGLTSPTDCRRLTLTERLRRVGGPG